MKNSFSWSFQGRGQEKMKANEENPGLNEIWERRIKDSGADFVYFVDVSMFPADITDGCTCAVLFGKALSKEYIKPFAAQDSSTPGRTGLYRQKQPAGNGAVRMCGVAGQGPYHGSLHNDKRRTPRTEMRRLQHLRRCVPDRRAARQDMEHYDYPR